MPSTKINSAKLMVKLNILRDFVIRNIYLAAAFAGAILNIAFAPFNFPIATFIAIPLFFLLIENSNGLKKSFYSGWIFGFFYFLFGVYWIAFSLTVDIKRFGWMIPFELIFINLFLGLFFAVFACVVKFLFRYHKSQFGRILIFSISWMIIEFLRGYILGGFPWNLIGYTWNFSVYTMQLASFIGIYGLGFVTILFCCTLILLIKKSRNKYSINKNATALIVVLALLIVLPSFRIAETDYHDIKLRLVQPGIADNYSVSYESVKHMLNLHFRLSTKKNTEKDDIQYIIWPESSVKVDLSPEYQWRELLRSIVPDNGALLLGGMRHEKNAAYNSLHVIADDKKQDDYYDKRKLVPFGEFLPMRKYLQPLFSAIGLSKVTLGSGDFSEGKGSPIIQSGILPNFRTLICYEAIFPKFTDLKKNQPAWLLNVSNDSWFGMSSGPYQHMEISRMRAVESGLPLVRVANTGISAIVDPYGRYIKSLKLGEQGVIDSNLPKAISGYSFYARNPIDGLLVSFGFLVICLLSIYKKYIVKKDT